MKVCFSFLCQFFHINQWSRLVSIVLTWRILPILNLSSLLISIYMTEIANFVLNILFHTDEYNCRV